MAEKRRARRPSRWVTRRISRWAWLAALLVALGPASDASAQQFAFEFGGPGSEGPARLGFANSVAVDADGNPWVADPPNDRIVKYDYNGRFVAELKAPVGGGPSFETPFGIGADDRGFVYVAQGSRQPGITKIDTGGRLARTFELVGQDGVTIHPHKIAVDGAGRLYVSDAVHRILIYSADGDLRDQIQLPPGWTPKDVAVDDGEIFVSARTDVVRVDQSAIRRYGSDRRLLNTIGPFDEQALEEIAVDPAGRVNVADFRNGVVRRFNRVGGGAETFGSKGIDFGQMLGPQGLAVDCRGNIYVGDSSLKKGLKFEVPGAPPPPCAPPPPGASPEAPRVTAVVAAQPMQRGDAAVIAATLTGAASRLEWDLTGDGKPEVVSSADQTALRFRPRPGREFTVDVRPVGPGGAGPAASQTFAAPPALGGKLAKAITTGVGKRPPVYAAGSAEALVNTPGSRPPCEQTAPTTVSSGSLEITGCLAPAMRLDHLPAGERGVVDRLARELDVPLLRRSVELAVGLTDAYVAKVAPVTLNDGVSVIPRSGASIVAYPQARALASSNAALDVAGVKLAARNDFVLNLNPSVDQQLVHSQPVSGLLKQAAFTDAIAPAIQALGARLVGDVDLDLVREGASFTINLRLPSFLRLAGDNAQARVRLLARDGELKIDQMKIGPMSIAIGELGVRDFQLDYSRAQDEWRGQGRACLPVGGCLDMIPSDGQVRIKNGRLAFAGATLVFNPSVPLFPGVDLERAGFGVGLDPTRLTGNARVRFARIVAVNGRWLTAFPSDRTPFVFRRDEIGGGFPTHFYGRHHTRTTVGISGETFVALPVVGNVRMGNAYLLYEYPGYAAFGGGFDYPFGVFLIRGHLGGELNLVEGLFNLHGNAEGCLNVVRPVCAGAIANVSRGRGGTGGAGGCLNLGGISVGGGVQWQRVTRPFIWPLDGCRWSRFTADVRSSTAASGGGVAAAEAGSPHVVRIRAGDPSRAIQLDGENGAPVVRVSGPGGQTLESSPDSGLTMSDDGAIRILRFEGSEEEGGSFTVVGLQDPRPGTYGIEPLGGSAAVSKVSAATDPPNARVTAKVRGRGGRRVLSYRIRPRPAQRVTFVEVGAGGEAKAIGTVTGGGRGRLRFSPAPGTGARRIEAQFELAGLPAERRVVARFQPPTPRLGRPLRVRVSRRGSTVRVRWEKVRGAARYEVVATPSGSTQRLRRSRSPRTVLKRIPKSSGGRVSVRALDRLRTGPAARARFRRTARRRSGVRALPRCRGAKRIVCKSR